MMDNGMTGRRIKAIRMGLGKTTKEFGKIISDRLNLDKPISGSLVSRWELGVNLPNNERIKAIAELGDITVDELLTGMSPDTKNIEVQKYTAIMDELIEWASKQRIAFTVEEIIKMASDIYFNTK